MDVRLRAARFALAAVLALQPVLASAAPASGDRVEPEARPGNAIPIAIPRTLEPGAGRGRIAPLPRVVAPIIELRPQAPASSFTINALPSVGHAGAVITLMGTIPAGHGPTAYHIDFGDGTFGPLDSGSNTQVLTMPFVVSHVYDAGNFLARIAGGVVGQAPLAAPVSITIAPLLRGTQSIVAAAAAPPTIPTLTVSPATFFAGGSTTFVATVPPVLVGGFSPTYVLQFGDGTSMVLPTGAATSIPHVYATTPATVPAIVTTINAVTTTVATAPISVVVPQGTLAVSSPIVFAGSPATITVGVNAIAGVTGPGLVLDFGDGSVPLQLPFANATVTHDFGSGRSAILRRAIVSGAFVVTLGTVGGTTLATARISVATPTASLTVAPIALLVGDTLTATLAVTPLGNLAGPMLVVDYGDGSQVVVAYANQTLQHRYTTPGARTITVTDPTGAVLARAPATVYQPSATITVGSNPILINTSVPVTVNVADIGGLVGPAPLTLYFGDGARATLPTYATATIPHTYTRSGPYNISVAGPTGTAFATSQLVTVVAQNQSLTVPLVPVPAHVPADISVKIVAPNGFAAAPQRLAYGDGTAILVATTGTYPHAYGAPGRYGVTLLDTRTGTIVASGVVVVQGVVSRVPLGSVYASTFTTSPVLAGATTNLLVTFSVAVPSLATIADPILGYVDVLDSAGKLVRRTDQFVIAPSDYAGAGVHTVSIPFDTPVDGRGTYQTRVVLASAAGGTIAVGPPATLVIIGGPDPEIKIDTQFHSTGALEVGPHAGRPGATFDPGLAVGFLLPTYSGILTGLYDPISRRSDPLLTIKSGAQQQVSAPDATPIPHLANGTESRSNSTFAIPDPAAAASSSPDDSPAPAGSTETHPGAPATPRPPRQPAHPFSELVGRGQATLPELLGGGSTLRGGDLVDTVGPTSIQVGYGYTALGTAVSSPQRGTIADLTRTLGTDGRLRLTYFARQDDPTRYPMPPGTTGALVTDSELLEFVSPTYRGFHLGAAGALSTAHGILGNYRTDDASDKFTFGYVHDQTNIVLDYHNAGPIFAVGGGPGATSDRVGFGSSAQLPLAKVGSLALGYSRDESRSAFSRQSDAFGTFNFTLPHASTLALGFKRDTQVASSSDIKTDSGTLAFGTHAGIGTLALSASLSATGDHMTPDNGATTRTASLQYAMQSNAHALGIGINASTVSGGGLNAQVGESVTYAFPFGGRVVGGAVVRGLELQLSGSNVASHGNGSAGYDQALTSILAFHLTRHLAIGLRGEYNWHGDIIDTNRRKSSALRLRLDLTQ